ncbi:MAG: flagellar hook protein FlgE [Paracoccaceae bacterium]
MTISSSLNAGVAGLNVNASKLATISDNIANSRTYGYKRADADFSSVVLTGGSGAYTAGGVTVTTFRDVSKQGSLLASSNPTDIAIGGRGMLPVTPVSSLSATGGLQELMFVTTGSFSLDSNGILRNSAGLALLGWPADSGGTVPQFPRDSGDGLETIQVNTTQFAADPTTEMRLGANLPADETRAGASGTPVSTVIAYYGNLGETQTITATFTPTVPATGQSNEWTVSFVDSATGAAPVAEFVVQFDGSQANGGAISTVTPSFGGTYNSTTGIFDMSVAGGPMAMEIGVPLASDTMTQLAASFSPTAISKNGSPVSNLAGLEIDEKGMLTALYESGFTRTLYQVPLADVPNPNGLKALNNQAFAISPESGEFYLWDAGDGPTGATIGFAREESTTDIAGELTQLIQTQRAYSSNAKIIQTVDEMLQETTNIKR